jgi:hypothetical protein
VKSPLAAGMGVSCERMRGWPPWSWVSVRGLMPRRWEMVVVKLAGVVELVDGKACRSD